jgi:hypothetical protein
MEILTIEEWGELKGRQKATLRMVQRHLERLFGPLGSDVQSRLEEMATQQLEELDEASFDFKNASDVTAWLKRNSSVKQGN